MAHSSPGGLAPVGQLGTVSQVASVEHGRGGSESSTGCFVECPEIGQQFAAPSGSDKEDTLESHPADLVAKASQGPQHARNAEAKCSWAPAAVRSQAQLAPASLPMIRRWTACRAATSSSTIAFAGHFSTQRLQPLRKRGQLVLDTVDLDPVLALLRDLPHGHQAPGRSTRSPRRCR